MRGAAPPHRPGIGRRRTTAWITVVGAAATACTREGALDPKGPVARDQIELFYIALWTSVAVFVITTGLLLYAMFRRRRADDAERFPSTRFVVVGGIVVPTGILLVMMVLTFVYLSRTPQDGELEITIVGYQYWWEAYYPDYDITTANEIHIPVGVPVTFRLETHDVIHSFWVPELGGKGDLVPGRTYELVLQADEPGAYRGQCAEYCGLQHANMGFLVIADEPEQFEAWAVAEAAPAAVQDTRGEELFAQHACAGCHTIRGTDATGDIGPDLTHLGNRTTLGAGTIPNTRGHLAGWIVNSQTVKPGNEMPPTTTLGPDELHLLVDYLRSLE